MVKNSLYISMMFIYINLLGYILHIIIARSLGPEYYGEFMVIYSFMLSIGFLSSVYPSLTIKMVIKDNTIKDGILRFLRMFSAFSGLVFFSIATLFSNQISDFLKVHRMYIFIVGFVWFFVFISSVEKGFIQAQERFGFYSLINSIELTLRFVFAITFLYVGYKIGGVLFSTLLSLMIISIVLYIKNGYIRGEYEFIDLKTILRTFLTAIPSGLFIYADDIFIKRVFDQKLAGLYASASVVGKAFIWFCITIFSMFFVKIIKDIKSYKNILFNYLVYTFILFAVVESLILLIGKPVFILLFGNSFYEALSIFYVYIPFNLPLIFVVVMIATNIALEILTKYVYIHLLIYYLGFIFIKFSSVYDYLLYIFSVNFLFFLIYVLIIHRFSFKG